MSPKWTTTLIRAGASRRREYVRLSGSGGCRSRRSREIGSQPCFRACRHCFRKRLPRRISCTPASPNANAMLHVANCVANAGRIESGDSYKFYAEGVTPAIARLYEAINAERVAVAAALGASVPTLADWFDRVYDVRGATLVETCQRLTYNGDGPYQATGTPKSLDHKCKDPMRKGEPFDVTHMAPSPALSVLRVLRQVSPVAAAGPSST